MTRPQNRFLTGRAFTILYGPAGKPPGTVGKATVERMIQDTQQKSKKRLARAVSRVACF